MVQCSIKPKGIGCLENGVYDKLIIIVILFYLLII